MTGSEKGAHVLQPQRCQSWLPSKRRFCASGALPGSMYCGNHKPSAAQSRVPCPIDPSHTVLQEEVAVHVQKCPAAKQLQWFEHQAYYCKGMNAGGENDHERIFMPGYRSISDSTNVSTTNCKIDDREVSCGIKRAAVSAMSGPSFWELLSKIDSAYRQSCGEHIEETIIQPIACGKWLDGERDRRLPYQEKHAVQQASLLGNLEAFGLLKTPQCSPQNGDGACDRSGPPHKDSQLACAVQQCAFVELGAGRGYLSHMLCDCYGADNIVMVERRSYKFKADRTLRQSRAISLERLRIDIEDLNLKEVPSLQGCHFVAVSKHLCGPATDLALRCCLYEPRNTSGNSSNPLSREGGREGPQRSVSSPQEPVLDGLGIATCCHHLCQWKSYVNKPFFHNLGFSVEEFQAITWLTSWALSGPGEHGAPNSEALLVADQPPSCLPQTSGGKSQEGIPSKAKLSEAMNSVDATERAALGRRCKQLIDMGRLLWLRERGMQAKLVNYVAAGVSPENKLLLARWASSRGIFHQPSEANQ